MTAAEHFKKMLGDALEQVCILREQLEQAQARIQDLEARKPRRR